MDSGFVAEIYDRLWLTSKAEQFPKGFLGLAKTQGEV
jgi:hypothetical protein